ncbi:hypothetical protein PAAG_08240 [Paracoccidioides lutzii Pb01]|uniref:Uncharacterized protein n=1 Tax=Paracoccidioides lutzii (strain ATCC MYA-826 / Pb01) TaxID=502779 RepID=C1HBU9_PARBA|nr:hypothetical protein PAAG_08240 [Paracoccidioides lutzii Pb01]EEH38513.2 hypothetical protein PAAG_08240 [Paracoccidioides lutzii Pb01]
MEAISAENRTFDILNMVSCGRDQDFGYYQIHTPQGSSQVSRACQAPTSLDFQVERRTLSSIETAWHSVRLEYASLVSESSVLHGTSNQSASPKWDHRLLGWSPEDIYSVSKDTEIYSLIEGHNIGPAFLAHITENGDSVIGYAVERIPGRRATIVFLVADDGHVVQHDFSESFLTGDDVAHAKYMDSLVDILWQGWLPPHRPLDQELGEKLEKIDKRDDGIHAVTLGQAVLQDKVDINRRSTENYLEN